MHMRNIHNSNETQDVSQRSIAVMFPSEDTRLITDLKTTAVTIKLRGTILISNIGISKERSIYNDACYKAILMIRYKAILIVTKLY
jgi:hypothetical protein